MRLTATDKAIGKLNMHRAGLELGKALIVKHGIENALAGIEGEIADTDRCIELLRYVAPAPKPEKVAKPRTPRKSKKSADTE